MTINRAELVEALCYETTRDQPTNLVKSIKKCKRMATASMRASSQSRLGGLSNDAELG